VQVLGNQQPIPLAEEGSTTIPSGSRAKWSEAQSTRNGDDIVSSASKVAAAYKAEYRTNILYYKVLTMIVFLKSEPKLALY
jgi:hypothetical protein